MPNPNYGQDFYGFPFGVDESPKPRNGLIDLYDRVHGNPVALRSAGSGARGPLSAIGGSKTQPTMYGILFESSRGQHFPGCYRREAPARGYIECLDPQDITDGTTITIADYINGADETFEFDTNASVGGGNVGIDVSSMTTPEEVAIELADEINDSTIHIVARAKGSRVLLVQWNDTVPLKYLGTWSQGAAGSPLTQGHHGNMSIGVAGPGAGDWAGRVVGMTGGRKRRKGVPMLTVGGGRRFVPVGIYFSAIEINIG